jgi:hypothetical protein
LLAAAVALLVGTACVLAAAARWRALAPGADLSAGHGVDARARALATRLLGVLEAEAFIEAVQRAPSREHTVAEINERSADLSRELDARAAVPRSAARIALSTGVLFAVVELSVELGSPGGISAWAVAPFAIGAVAAVTSAQLGRLADSRSKQVRAEWLELGSLVLRLGKPQDFPEDGADELDHAR